MNSRSPFSVLLPTGSEPHAQARGCFFKRRPIAQVPMRLTWGSDFLPANTVPKQPLTITSTSVKLAISANLQCNSKWTFSYNVTKFQLEGLS